MFTQKHKKFDTLWPLELKQTFQMVPQYVWIPSNQNEKAAFTSNSLLEAIKAVAVTGSYNRNNIPRGRVMFVGSQENRIFIDETSLCNAVNNDNLTEQGLSAFIHSHGFTTHIKYIRFPSRGYLLEIPYYLPNQNSVWLHVNANSIRDDFSDTVSYVENLSTSLYNRSRMNHPYNVVEDGQITMQSVHLIEDEIPESLRYIEQSGNQWHKATPLHNKQKVNTFITMKMVNNTTLAATTTPLTLRYLALIHTANLYKNMSENESKTTLVALKKTFENLSEDTQKTTYETLYNNVLNSHRSSFELIGWLNWTNTEPILEYSTNDVLIL
jgi:hypothetical protein